MVTELGVLARGGLGKPLRLIAVHPGISADQVRNATGWELEVADDLATVPPPEPAELERLRTEVDPERVYLR